MPQHYDPARHIDLRSLQTNPPVDPNTKKIRYQLGPDHKVLVRDPATVHGICIHQTACIFGVTKQMVAAAGGDANMAKYKRLMTVPAHAVASVTGKFVTHIPLRWYAQHGHGWNPMSLGLECEAFAAGLRSQTKTWNGQPVVPITAEAIASYKAAVGFLYEEGRNEGMPIEYIWAHRQSTAKSSDPGEIIWSEVVEDFAIKELGLKAEYGRVLTDRTGHKGQPIPVEWAKGGVGHY